MDLWFWYFTCGFMWGTCLYMPNFKKTVVRIRQVSKFLHEEALEPWNLYAKFDEAQLSQLGIENLIKLIQVSRAYPDQIAQGVPNCKFFGPFLPTSNGFSVFFWSLYPSETLELGFYTSYELASPFAKNWQAYFSFFSEKCQKSKIAKFWKISKPNISKTI